MSQISIESNIPALMNHDDFKYRFSGIERVYGDGALEKLTAVHAMVIGVGGVGSWTAEALVRSGVGEITLVDLDDVCLSNSNRQLHAMTSQVGKLKIKSLADRFQDINPYLKINLVADWANQDTIDQLLNLKPTVVIDAIDKAHNKTILISECVKHKISIVTVGAAGGKTKGSKVQIKDLAFTQYDSLLSQTRRRLRQEKGFTRNVEKPFKISAVYSEELVKKPWEVCEGLAHPARSSNRALDCSTGFGAITHVTGTFGFLAAERALELALSAVPHQK